MSNKAIGKRVMALKAKGLSFSQIGAKMGVSKQRAHRIHTRIHNERLRPINADA